MSQDILNKKTWTTRHVVIAVLFSVSITFSATLIWARFLYMETEIQVLSDRLEKKDKRTIEDIEDLESRVKKLELPNTD